MGTATKSPKEIVTIAERVLAFWTAQGLEDPPISRDLLKHFKALFNPGAAARFTLAELRRDISRCSWRIGNDVDHTIEEIGARFGLESSEYLSVTGKSAVVPKALTIDQEIKDAQKEYAQTKKIADNLRAKTKAGSQEYKARQRQHEQLKRSLEKLVRRLKDESRDLEMLHGKLRTFEIGERDSYKRLQALIERRKGMKAYEKHLKRSRVACVD